MIRTSEDYVVFGDKQTVSGGTDSYDDSYTKLKKYYYAVMMHGNKKYVYGPNDEQWTASTVAPKIEGFYRRFGKNRALLLVICWAGWGVGQEIARALSLPVVAAHSSVAFGYAYSKAYKGDCLIAADETGLDAQSGNHAVKYGDFKAEWIFIHPSGNEEIIPGGGVLRQDEATLRAQKYVK